MNGKNVVGVLLGTGWYSGRVGGGFNHYGSEESVLVQLYITYDDGKSEVINSDDSWKVNTGPIIYSDFLMGELHYANREIPGWNNVDFDG